MGIGVPQGSTVGPLMCIVYINDLPEAVKRSQALMYADDTVLYCGLTSCKRARNDMQDDLLRVQNWCLLNRLTLNVKKTKIMSFMSDHKRKHCNPLKLYMKGQLIDVVGSYKYLGTTVDDRLAGEPQYNALLKNLGFKLRTFGKIRRYLTTKAALMVYKSTILPIIDYNDYFQLLWNAGKLHKLQKQQNWGLRIVFNDRQPKLDEDALHREANIHTLKYRRVAHLLNLMYFRSKEDRFLDKRNIPTRQFDKIKFKVINPVVSKVFKSPNYLGAQLWDLLPHETQSSASISEFKSKVKRHIDEGLFSQV